jgi:hypothetical protein
MQNTKAHEKGERFELLRCKRERSLRACCITSELTGDRGIGAVRRTPLGVRVEQPVRGHYPAPAASRKRHGISPNEFEK